MAGYEEWSDSREGDTVVGESERESVVYVGSKSAGEAALLEYIRAQPSKSPPLTLSTMSFRPPAFSSAQLQASNSEWYDPEQYDVSPSSAYIVDSPSNVVPSPASATPPHLRRPVSQSPSREESFAVDSNQAHSPGRSPQLGNLPDPSQYPDPYPLRPQRFQGTSTPALSWADSPSTSTRSSAYTNSAKSGDYGHVHVALGGDDSAGVGITSDDVVQLLAQDPTNSTSAIQPRVPVEASRWSDHYTNSVRSRSSSGGNVRLDAAPETTGGHPLTEKKSFDMSWQLDERDEIGLTSEDETDDEQIIDVDDGDDDLPTSAMIIAEEGLGIIVRGEDTPIVQLQVQPGTTHLLIGSSPTPNAVPSFLTNVVPHITTTLLALDISANFLVALPPALSSCICLEELNIASNPLRALPLFLSSLISLKVLIADSTGISTLPTQFSALDKLHSLSIRRNKMHSLPSWLCLLPAMETLLVDGNPFQGPWKALVEPLLAKTPMSPLYPPSTPIFPPPSASIRSGTETDVDDELPSDGDRPSTQHVEDEDTIMPSRASYLNRAVTAPLPSPKSGQAPTLQRTRTTPNRGFHERTRAVSKAGIEAVPMPSTSKLVSDAGERELRKMKSAGELRRNHVLSVASGISGSSSATTSPQRPPAMSHYITSASSSNLLTAGSAEEDPKAKRFASLGVNSGLMSPGGRPRPAVDHSIWDNISGDEGEGNAQPSAVLRKRSPTMPSRSPSTRSPPKVRDSRYTEQTKAGKEEKDKDKDKSTRWGFLKKMSMGKMRTTDSPSSSRPNTSQGRSGPTSQRLTRTPSDSNTDGPLGGGTPKIDVRISTTGALLARDLPTSVGKELPSDRLNFSPPPPIPEKDSPSDTLKPPTPLLAPPSGSANLLVPPTITPRAAKRRSFLPIDVSPIPVPSPSQFIANVTATSEGADEPQDGRLSVNTIPQETMEQLQRREEEKAREARQRALRSVMAYLRDMHDLGLNQTNAISMYGGPTALAPAEGLRSRRPTIVENGRLPSEASLGSNTSSMISRQDSTLRNSEARYGIRSGTSTQTNSVATTDSNGSGSGNGEERKWKDDKAKRARVVREIVETERTYVKGLQELVDIYINPASASVNVLSGVGQTKETLVPAAERKIVFNGLESLYSFHHSNFLPALEAAAAPLLRPPNDIAQADQDGQMSLTVSRTVAQTFVSHAAFMRMYSTYINNFDNSVQRIKTWLSDRPSTPAAQTLSPSSSTSQLVGFGLTMSAVSAPNVVPDNSNGAANLTSSQKKRIKTFLKRCQMNPRHSQLNLESYLLLPVQRIPRYKLLLEELLRSCPPMYEYMEDPLDRALSEISVLATNMNEGKRESESRRRLVIWQSRIRGKFPSPLVQPHRRLIMDGRLHLTRVVRKATVAFEVIDSKGDASTIQVECLSPELTPRSLVGVLCNDLLVLCRDPSDGQDPNAQVDLWAVLRMQTLPQPASIVHGNALRLVDNKAILYFEAPSTSDAVTWYRAINMNMAQKP